jgi:hypothetical protein
VGWSLAPAERQTVLGDLHEEFVHLRDRAGAATARRWYWKQTVRSIVPNALRRYRNDERRQKECHQGLRILVLGLMMGLMSLAHTVTLRGNFGAGFGWPYFALYTLSGTFAVVRAIFSKRARFFAAQQRAQWWIAGGLFVALLAMSWMFRIYLWDHRGDEPVPAIYWLAVAAITAASASATFWPWWPKDPAPPPPTEFFVRKTARSDDEEGRWMTVAVPNTPLGLSGLVLSAAQGAASESTPAIGVRVEAPTLRRRFSENETVRIYAAVNGAESGASATMEVIDATGHVVRALPIQVATNGLERVIKASDADDDEDEPTPRPSERFGQVDVRPPLAQFPPGPYRVRLTVHDAAHSSVQQDGFVVMPAANQS